MAVPEKHLQRPEPIRDALEDERWRGRRVDPSVSQPLRLRPKRPLLAALLSFLFGPFGYLYIGWRYAVMAAVMWFVFVGVLVAADVPMPPALKLVVFAVFAWKAFTICQVRNHLIENGDDHVRFLDTFWCATLAMTDLLVGIAMFYAAALGLLTTVHLMLGGRVGGGLFMLLLGTPALVRIASMVFGLIATGMDAMILAGGGATNRFRAGVAGSRLSQG